MTTDERLAAIEDDYFHYEDRDDADVRWLIAEVRRLAGENVKLRTRLKEQTAATQEAHEFVDNEIRSHLKGFVELGDNSCPVWQRVRSAVARLTDEVRRLQGENKQLQENYEMAKRIIHSAGGLTRETLP